MSLVILINGPVARAGLFSVFLMLEARNVPNTEAKTTTANRERDTAIVVTCDIPRVSMLYTKTSNDIMLALISPTPNSFIICCHVVAASSDPLASPCTIMADDCMPTFPPVPPISGMKSAIVGLTANPASKRLRIMEFARPPSMPIKSQRQAYARLGKETCVCCYVARQT